MRTIRISLCLTAILLASPVTEVTAQQTNGNRSVNKRERIARANWRPTRPAAKGEADAETVVQVDHNVPINGLPRIPAGTVSVIDPPIKAAPIQEAPLDGQIVAPHYDGACDSLPAGTCGCGDTACDGCCDAVPCDGGCDTGCCDGIGCDGPCGGLGCSCCGELCSPEAWRPCVTICVPQDGWASLEYLSWWQDGMRLPPLVTTSVTNDVPPAEAGVLTSPTTRILFGGRQVLDNQFDGGRLRFGLWLDRCHNWGVGAEYFQIGSESVNYRRTSTGDPILARPFFNTQTGVQDSELVAYPDIISGTVGVRAESELQGAGFYFRNLRCCDQGCSKWLFSQCPEPYCCRTEALFGYRYLELDERVTITEDLVADEGTFAIVDRFETRNQFNGFDLGWSHRHTRGCWTYDALLKMAVGSTHQTVRISGNQVINSELNDPPLQVFDQGFLTQESNIGTYTADRFSVVPEFNANIGYQLTDHWRVFLGYTAIYWSNVVRPGEQIDLDLNPQQVQPREGPITGARRPRFRWDTIDYWVQGINLGVELRW